ncbi:hypothetical protein Poli38472_012820 [Pythium oligandrum]|uniref:Carbonic anhydrase n=1 Tax=Pythium oligandrum TaxID=41045 RepID=A0A8K1FN17_PYTOL|nr:hypothetical protein Poli38472_012820 [Pythium oligandrum]|eukprot:TMW64198.1 hypothetical protein Poli38472_012820 [Pythium oligandrum]
MVPSPQSPRSPLRLPHLQARQRTQEMLADSLAIQSLLENNIRWRNKKKRSDAEFFERMAEKQTPRYLWIGCSDSRVPAEEVTGLHPGEMFVHRNVANLVVSNDISSLSVIQFAVEKLQVRDIIVCGHYGCGGVQAAMENKTLGLLDNWLRNIRDVCRLYQPELVKISTEKERSRRIVELNIIEQCLNIFKINMVQNHQLKYGFPRIHGLVYDLHSGELRELSIDFRGYLRRFQGIYRLHSAPTDDIPRSRTQLQVNMVRDIVNGNEEEEGRISVRFLTRMLKKENVLFSESEVEGCIAHAKTLERDPRSPFINVEAVIQFFMEPDEVQENSDDDEDNE